MLKKHVKTHSDMRPYTCRFCNFAFKTKGNLTKHMKSKAHHKKCVELCIIPVPTCVEDLDRIPFSNNPNNMAYGMEGSVGGTGLMLAGDDSDNDDMEEGDEDQFDDAEEEIEIDVVGTESDQEDGKENKNRGPVDHSLGLFPMGRPKPSFCTYNISSVNSSSDDPVQVPTTSIRNTAVVVSRPTSQHETFSIKEDPEDGTKGQSQSLISPQAGSKERYYFPSIKGDSISPDNGSDKAKVAADTVLALTKVSVPPNVCIKAQDPPNVVPVSALAVKPNLTLTETASISIFKASSSQATPSSKEVLSAVTDSSAIISYLDKASAKVPSTKSSLKDGEYQPGFQAYLQERGAMMASKMNPSPAPNKGQTEAERLLRSKLDATCQEIMAQSSMQLSPPVTSTGMMMDKKRPHNIPPKVMEGSYAAPRNVTMNVKDLPPKVLAQVPSGAGQATLNPSKPEVPPNVQAPIITSPSKVKHGKSSEESCPKSEAEHRPEVRLNDSDDNIKEIFQTNEEGKSVCGICSKIFSKHSQLRLHVNIHYFERPFRCDACSVSFRTKGHLQKHKRSVGHFNKVNINATFGAPSTSNPRPFKCSDCKIAFRIHGHLAKHLRSKMHIMKLECSGQLPIGMFAEMERLGTNLNEIDTSDCENSLESLRMIAAKLYNNKELLKTPTVTSESPSTSTCTNDIMKEVKEEPLDVVNVERPPPNQVAPQSGYQVVSSSNDTDSDTVSCSSTWIW